MDSSLSATYASTPADPTHLPPPLHTQHWRITPPPRTKKLWGWGGGFCGEPAAKHSWHNAESGLQVELGLTLKRSIYQACVPANKAEVPSLHRGTGWRRPVHGGLTSSLLRNEALEDPSGERHGPEPWICLWLLLRFYSLIQEVFVRSRGTCLTTLLEIMSKKK